MREQSQRVNTSDGAALHVTVWEADEGQYREPARDVLLLHGWPNAGDVWRYFAEALILAENCRLLAPDLRGYGQSNKPNAGCTNAQFADDVLAVAAAMELRRYALVGHSMSGKIAQVAAAQKPSELAALVLLAPTPLAPPPSPPEAIEKQRGMFGDKSATQEFLTKLTARPLRPERMTVLLDEAAQVGQAAWNAWGDTMRDEPLDELAAQITVPTLVIAGGKDSLRTPDALQTQVVGKIAGAKLEVLPNVGHLAHVEEPSALALIIANFLDEMVPVK